jgi:polar amino acid transport system substrate-binding protein
VVWALTGRTSLAEPLRLVTDGYMAEHLADDKSPGFAAEVIRRIFADLGQDVSLEQFPLNRAWRMVLRGEREGVLITERTHEREQICSFPDEPLVHDTWVLFVRTADAGKLKFSSFEDLIGHNVAVFEPTPGIFEQTYHWNYGNSCATITTWSKRGAIARAWQCWWRVASITWSIT